MTKGKNGFYDPSVHIPTARKISLFQLLIRLVLAFIVVGLLGLLLFSRVKPRTVTNTADRATSNPTHPVNILTPPPQVDHKLLPEIGSVKASEDLRAQISSKSNPITKSNSAQLSPRSQQKNIAESEVDITASASAQAGLASAHASAGSAAAYASVSFNDE